MKWIFVGLTSIAIVIVIVGLSIFGVNKFQKDDIINFYDEIIQFFGDDSLTSDEKLAGKRKFGVDHYVGTYDATYDNYTGKEILFGGTSLNRKNGDHINLKIQVEKEAGNIKIINRLGEKDNTILEDTGEYNASIYVENISYYLVVQLANFKGNLKIEIN